MGDDYDLGMLRELVEAYREDRYIVLKEPRQVGVHRLSELAQADREGRIKILTGFECPACGEKTLLARVDKAFYYEFTCPLCGGKAVAHRNSYNLHASARCEHCGGVCHEMYGGCKK